MAINIDGLTAAGALDPNGLMELQQAGVNKKLELGDLWVIAKGLNTLSIYKSATATTTIRPGNIHINDGTDDYLRESTSFSTVNISGATGWSFITCTQALAFTQRAATGAVTSRPTATCYTYVDGADTGYNHTKAGYYYSADERIIGAVYWDGSAIQYIINNLSGSDEIGKNSLGEWEQRNNVVTIDMWGYITGGGYTNVQDLDNPLPITPLAQYLNVVGTITGYNAGVPTSRFDVGGPAGGAETCGATIASDQLDVGVSSPAAMGATTRYVWQVQITGYRHL